MEERYHATTQNRFYSDMSNVNKNISVVAKLISPPTYKVGHTAFESYRGRNFTLVQNVRTTSVACSTTYWTCTGSCSHTTVKWLGRETNHSLASSAESKNEWSYTSIHGVCRNSFTLSQRKQFNSVAFTNVTLAPGFPWYLTAVIAKPRVATHSRCFLWWWVRPRTVWVSTAMRFMDFLCYEQIS